MAAHPLADRARFPDVSAAVVAATIFFAVLDLVAAVGLWLVAPWGGVVWLLTADGANFRLSVKPAFSWAAGSDRAVRWRAAGAYLFLSWRANRRANGDDRARASWLFDQLLLLARLRKSKADPPRGRNSQRKQLVLIHRGFTSITPKSR